MMKVVGLITEYNPFHNGHKYHIEEAKRITSADYVIAVMSGNFVQRGTPAMIDKYSRTAMALNNGVDLVLELPVCYATGSAEYFAHGAVALLDRLGIVDSLCFGSECGDISLLSQAAEFLLRSPDAYEGLLQELLREGLTYPAARVKALEHSLKASTEADASALVKVLAEPNNILGIEYMKALRSLSSDITPLTIRRISAHYHDAKLSLNTLESSSPATDILNQNDLELCDPIISSATALRNAIHTLADHPKGNFTEALASVPADVAAFLIQNYHKSYPISEEDFAPILKYKLLHETSQSLEEYQDITPDLAKRLKKLPDYNKSISTLAKNIKTRNMTLTRINRALIHLLLDIKAEELKQQINLGYVPYARVLGIKKESSRLLKLIEKNGRIPVITKVSKAALSLETHGLQLLSQDLFATHLYNQLVFEKYGTVIPNEYKHGIILL